MTMTSSSSSSSPIPSFSSSSSSACAACLRKEKTVCNKAHELSVLCGIDVCLIGHESNNNFKIWPGDNPVKVRDMAERFTKLPEPARHMRSVTARDLLEAKGKLNKPEKKRQKTNNWSNSGEKYSTFNPDDHSSQRLKEALASLQHKLKSLHEPKPVKQQQQQQQQLSLISLEPVLTNQDLTSPPVFKETEYSDLLEDEEDWSNPNLAYGADQECLAMLKEEEEIGNNQEKQETWSQYLDIPIDPHSYYLPLYSDQENRETCNQDLDLPINTNSDDMDVCLINHESNNNFKIWPADNPVTVRDTAERFTELPKAARRIGSFNARHDLLEPKGKPNLPEKKRQRTNNWPNSGEEYSTLSLDNHSSEPCKEALVSLQLKFKSMDQPKPVKQQQQLSLISSESVPTNQDLTSPPVNEDLFVEEEDWSNPNLAYNDEECLAILKGEDIGNNQEKQETWNQDLDRPIDPNSDSIDVSNYLQDFSDQEKQETWNQDLDLPIKLNFEDIDISKCLQEFSDQQNRETWNQSQL